MVVSFCIKEPLDFTRVPQIELKFSKFPGGDPQYPPMGGGNPLPYLPHVGSTNNRKRFAPSLAGSISSRQNQQANFLATTLKFL